MPPAKRLCKVCLATLTILRAASRLLHMDTATKEQEMQTDATATMTRLYNIMDALRTARPDSFRSDFALVFDTFRANGPDAANALVTVMLDEA